VRTATRYLWALCVFAIVLGTIYWFLTYEATGAVLLWALGLMPLIVATWVTRRGVLREPTAEDDAAADPHAAAGEVVGSFPMASAWPVFLVLGVITVGASLVYGLILLVPGVALMGYAVFGLMRESRN
jgi:Cytochrome c oxidase subunit IV